jgi:hypothetical protein
MSASPFASCLPALPGILSLSPKGASCSAIWSGTTPCCYRVVAIAGANGVSSSFFSSIMQRLRSRGVHLCPSSPFPFALPNQGPGNRYFLADFFFISRVIF